MSNYRLVWIMIDSLIFQVKSSSVTNGYFVVINQYPDQTICSCDCSAGKFGKLCKHKLAVLIGNVDVLIDPSQSSALLNFARVIETSRIGLGVKALLEAELEAERAKQRVVSLRSQLEKALRE